LPESRPEQIGRYRIQRELGRGMMGVVYEALDPSLHRTVALKVVRMVFAVTDEERETFEKRFVSEARIAARLSHPGIVVVHDVGRDPESGLLYIALERLSGRTLAEMTAEGARVGWKEALAIVGQVAQALHYAHSQGVVHRDIKPANIMVLPSGEPKIMDFGLAKTEAGADLTAAGQSPGTPLFMSPEQVQGRKLDGRSDLFSLGSVLYTVLTGARPFAADSVPRIMNRVAHQDPRPATAVVSELPADVDYLLARSMAKKPEDRYPDGRTMAEDVEDVLRGRAPRHRKGWKTPAPAESTLVSPTPAEEASLLELDLKQAPPVPRAPAPGPRARRGPRVLRLLALGLLLGGLVTYYLSARNGDPLADALLLLFAPSPPPAAVPWRVPATPELHRESPAAAAESPRPETGTDTAAAPAREPPSPTEAPPPAEAPAPAATPATPPETPKAKPPKAAPKAKPTPSPSPPKKEAPAPALLSIRMEHRQAGGSILVYLDDKLVAEEGLDAEVTRKILFFTMRKGVVEETLKVAPGRHEVRVTVREDDGDVKTKRIGGLFRSGMTRRLSVSISRLGGDLSLEWK
jgi:serine/threonine-protein kinase